MGLPPQERLRCVDTPRARTQTPVDSTGELASTGSGETDKSNFAYIFLGFCAILYTNCLFDPYRESLAAGDSRRNVGTSEAALTFPIPLTIFAPKKRRVRRDAVGSLRSTGADMKIRNSLRSLAKRHRDNRMVRRKGRIYIINKTNPRYKARQG